MYYIHRQGGVQKNSTGVGKPEGVYVGRALKVVRGFPQRCGIDSDLQCARRAQFTRAIVTEISSDRLETLSDDRRLHVLWPSDAQLYGKTYVLRAIWLRGGF